MLALDWDEKSQGIILVPVKGMAVTQIPTPPWSRPYGLQGNPHLMEGALLAGPPHPQQHSCAGQTGPTLVDELVEGVLAIGPGSPHNGACLVVHADAGLGDVISPLDSMSPLNRGQKPVPSICKSCSSHTIPKTCLGCTRYACPAP